jgi:hypothetical protein
MLLNTVTERCYIGATDGTLEERWQRHLKETTIGTSRLGRALATWPAEIWLPVVLCNCYSSEELSAAERAWQLECNAFDDGVGYNEHRGSYESTVNAGKRGGDPLIAAVRPSSPLAGMTLEQRREYFREAGRRGAARSKKG